MWLQTSSQLLLIDINIALGDIRHIFFCVLLCLDIFHDVDLDFIEIFNGFWRQMKAFSTLTVISLIKI